MSSRKNSSLVDKDRNCYQIKQNASTTSQHSTTSGKFSYIKSEFDLNP